jgi:hypothetical protein
VREKKKKFYPQIQGVTNLSPLRACSVRGGLIGIGGDSILFYTNLNRRGFNPLQSPLNPFKPNKP